jgi:hypothetical protein
MQTRRSTRDRYRPAARYFDGALFRTYLDLNAFPRVRLKLFVRKDLFGRIIAGGFVNLTHVNARKIEIVWDEDDLFDLLFRRIKENDSFLADVGLDEPDAQRVFDAVFPDQVDPGERKPKTWTWMMARIRDGNGIRPPRNLIDLVKKAQEEQMRREERASTEYAEGTPLIGSEALKKGLARLSTERVQDTLLAEAGEEHALWIEKFRDGRAEHNQETIAATLGLDGGDFNRAGARAQRPRVSRARWGDVQSPDALSRRLEHHSGQSVRAAGSGV